MVGAWLRRVFALAAALAVAGCPHALNRSPTDSGAARDRALITW